MGTAAAAGRRSRWFRCDGNQPVLIRGGGRNAGTQASALVSSAMTRTAREAKTKAEVSLSVRNVPGLWNTRSRNAPAAQPTSRSTASPVKTTTPDLHRQLRDGLRQPCLPAPVSGRQAQDRHQLHPRNHPQPRRRHHRHGDHPDGSAPQPESNRRRRRDGAPAGVPASPPLRPDPGLLPSQPTASGAGNSNSSCAPVSASRHATARRLRTTRKACSWMTTSELESLQHLIGEDTCQGVEAHRVAGGVGSDLQRRGTQDRSPCRSRFSSRHWPRLWLGDRRAYVHHSRSPRSGVLAGCPHRSWGRGAAGRRPPGTVPARTICPQPDVVKAQALLEPAAESSLFSRGSLTVTDALAMPLPHVPRRPDVNAHAGRVPTRRLPYSTRTRTPWERHEATGQLVEGSRCRGFKPIRAGGKACAHAQEQLAGPGVIRRVQTRSPTPTIASATVRRLAWLLRAWPRISW